MEGVFNPFIAVSEVLMASGPVRIRGTKMMTMQQSRASNFAGSDIAYKDAADHDVVVGYAPKAANVENAETSKVGTPATLRDNLNETAFFFPNLMTDANGNVSLTFTLPESVGNELRSAQR